MVAMLNSIGTTNYGLIEIRAKRKKKVRLTINKEKQIEEMVIALNESQHEFDKAWHECLHNKGKQPERENVFYAKYLVEKKGYRKASEVVDEVFELLKNELRGYIGLNYLDELKKKYTKNKGE